MGKKLSYTAIPGFTGSASRHPLFLRWREMKKRCYQPTRPGYKYYGAIGITVCQRWHDFGLFVIDMGMPPEGHTLERNDPAKNYEPGNCRWATPAEQMRNISSNVWVEIDGERLTVVDWAEKNLLPAGLCWARIRDLNWDPVDAVTLPVRRGKKYSERTGK